MLVREEVVFAAHVGHLQESQALSSERLGSPALYFPVQSDPLERGYRLCARACLITADLYTTIGMVSKKKRASRKGNEGRGGEMQRRSYPSDLNEQEWAILEPLIPPAKPGGHPRTTDMREVINAILYLDRTGCQWRALPHEFPPWSTVWSYFRTWRNNGTWKRMHTALREAVRVKQGREPTPSATIIDSQSVKTSQKGGGAATMAASA